MKTVAFDISSSSAMHKASGVVPVKQKRLPDSEKRKISQHLSFNYNKNQLKCGEINQLAKDYG